MHAETHVSPVDPWALDEAERVALAYQQAAKGDAWTALVTLARDAMTDREALEDRVRACAAKVSRGYVRGPIDA